MSDQTNNYVMVLTAEYFDLWTGFSKEFPSVTPNMVSMIHIIIALIASKYISSDNLKDRRHGVIMFEIKTWLDSLDGVIHRSHSNDPVYKSHKTTLGYFVDGISDTISGIGISLGVLFFLFKTRHGNNKVRKTNLPADIENNIDNYEKVHLPENSKKSLIWICWCYGFQIAVASASWDKRIEGMEYVLQTDLKNKTQTALQTSMLHSLTTWCVMYIWKLLCGLSLLQVYMVVIFMDKIWEFLSFLQYIGYVVLFILNIITVLHITHMKAVIDIK